jgi:S1-C subfamily serine protease
VLFGRWFRGRMPTQTLRKADRFGGGALGLVGVVFTVWLVVPMMAHIPGWPAESSRASAVGRLVADRLPVGPDLLGSVRRLAKGGQFPVVVSAIERSLDGGLPPVEAPLDLTTQTLVEASVVEVSATTCGLLSDGSGFSVGDGNVVTNAHVIAGASAVSVVDNDGVVRPASVTVLDARRDLALLHVDGYRAAPLSYGEPDLGEEVGVFGHPIGGALRVAPAGVREMLDSVGRDIYDGKRTKRPVLVLSGKLEPGDSGAAVVARSGRLVGVAFAVAPDRPNTAYALPVSELQAFLDTAKNPTGAGIPGHCLR